MGCQGCKGVEKNKELMIREILKCIDNENTVELSFFLITFIKTEKKISKSVIDSRVVTVNNIKLSFLSYTLFAGSVKSFRILHEKFSASIRDLLENFNINGLDALNLICEKHHFYLLKYFLPLYTKYQQNLLSSISDTLDFKIPPPLKESTDSFFPIQVAVLFGSIPIVDYSYNHDLISPSPLFNIEEINEEFGETCALLAVRSGVLGMVKLLHRKYQQKFSVVNRFGENALQFCAASSARNVEVSYLEIFVYLIEEAEVNSVLNYEEVLIVLSDEEIIEYYECVLRDRGIMTCKKGVEKDVGVRVRQRIQTQFENSEKESWGKCSLGTTISQDSKSGSFLVEVF